MRQSEDFPLDPELLAELEVIEATLAGEVVDPIHAELAELTLLLAADRPRIPTGTAHRLDARVAQRFAFVPAKASRRRWLPAWALSPGFGVAGAAVAAVVVIAIVGIPGGGSSTSTNGNLSPVYGSSSSAASSSSAPRSVPRAKAQLGALKTARNSNGARAAASHAAASGSAAGALSPPQSNQGLPQALSPAPTPNGRRITQSAQLQLLTPSARIDTVAQELFNVVGQVQGVVKSSTITAAAGNGGFASFSLSIPSGNLSQTMTRLSSLPYAHVASRTDATQDVNNQYLSDVRRLGDARALRTSLLKQLAAATTTEAVTSLTAQIHDAEASISSDESTLNGLNHQIAYSGLSVQINSGPVPVPLAGQSGKSAGGFTIGKAAHDAGRVLTVAAGVVLIALAALLPVALIAALAMWIAHMVRARRREQALDAA